MWIKVQHILVMQKRTLRAWRVFDIRRRDVNGGALEELLNI